MALSTPHERETPFRCAICQRYTDVCGMGGTFGCEPSGRFVFVCTTCPLPPGRENKGVTVHDTLCLSHVALALEKLALGEEHVVPGAIYADWKRDDERGEPYDEIIGYEEWARVCWTCDAVIDPTTAVSCLQCQVARYCTDRCRMIHAAIHARACTKTIQFFA